MNTKINFDYYRGFQGDMHSFYRIPKVLFTHSYFQSLSCEAKVLYGLMLDRMSLSIQNHWLDEENRAYIVFSIDDVMKMLSCSKGKAVDLIKSLTEIGLIEKKRLGFGKANIIYVKNFSLEEYPEEINLPDHEVKIAENNEDLQKFKNRTSRSSKTELQEVQKSDFKKFENQTSRSSKIEIQEVQKSKCNKTKYNKTENNIDSYLSYPSQREDRMDLMEQRNAYKELIKENIEYDLLCEKYGATVVDEQVELMLETVCTSKPFLKINGEELPSQIVKQRLLKLSYQDIEYVFYALSNTTTQVKNIRQYMLTVLYNAPTTRKQFYNAQVRHDMSV